MSFQEKFKNARKMKGLNQQQLADELGLCRSAIAKYECGISKPNFEKIKIIHDMLDLSYEEIFE